jgi:hypothetical protein
MFALFRSTGKQWNVDQQRYCQALQYLLSGLPCLCIKLFWWNLLLRLFVSHVYRILPNTCVLILKSSVCKTAGRILEAGWFEFWNLFRLGQLWDRRLCVLINCLVTVQPVIGPVTRPTAHGWWWDCHGLKSFAAAVHQGSIVVVHHDMFSFARGPVSALPDSRFSGLSASLVRGV